MQREVQECSFLGACFGLGGPNSGPARAPQAIRNSPYLSKRFGSWFKAWEADIIPPDLVHPMAVVSSLAQGAERLAEQTARLVRQNRRFVVIGGDHSCAIGTWSGVASALPIPSSLGLLWIDAHMDAHTEETTESGRYHGMPLACLLGHGNSRLTQMMGAWPKLSLEHVALYGVRSYESGERALLERLGVRIYMIEEIQRRGVAATFQEALDQVRWAEGGFGVSLDLDAFDPEEVPGVNCRVPEGLPGLPMLRCFKDLAQDPRLLGLEIVEFNPDCDVEAKTERFIASVLSSFWGYEDAQ